MLNVKHGSVLCKFGNSTYCLIFYNDLIQTDSHIPEEAGFVMQGLLRVLRLRIPSPSERSRWAGLSLWLRRTTANRVTIQGCFASSYQMTNRVSLSLLLSLCMWQELSSFLLCQLILFLAESHVPGGPPLGSQHDPHPPCVSQTSATANVPRLRLTCVTHPLRSLTASQLIQA